MHSSLLRTQKGLQHATNALSDLQITYEDVHDEEAESGGSTPEPLNQLPFPPVTKTHIMNCSYHSWHPRYRSVTPKARLIPLTSPFLSYLRADGIILPADDDTRPDWSDSDSGIFSAADNTDVESDASDDDDPSAEWRELHQAIKDTIEELGGKVVPKLNWSAPKDATWINPTNSMECRTPNDVYMMLKSSDFVTHDLEYAFDGCVDDLSDTIQDVSGIPYHLVLRKHFLLNPSLEFRCFVRERRIIGMCQRDLNHFEFLFKMRDELGNRIRRFFDEKLRDTFPDQNFAFDVYIPPPHDKVWLVDINPWAQRTDPLLFSWQELLTMLGPNAASSRKADAVWNSEAAPDEPPEEGIEEEADEDIFIPEFRLVKRDDPEAYGFTTPQYSAHKLPRDVVDASRGGESSLREFALQWKEVLAQAQKEDEAEDSGDD